MISPEFRLLILLTAAGAAAAAWRARRTIQADWNASTTVVIGVAWLLNTEHISAAILGDYRQNTDLRSPAYMFIVYGHRAEVAYKAALVVLVVAGGAYAIYRLLDRAPWNPTGIVAAVMLGLALFSSWWNGTAPADSRQTVAMLVVVALAIACEPGAGARMGAALYGVSATVVSAFLLALHPDAVTRQCGTNKCGVLDVLYTGAFTNENAFGLSLAVSLPFVLLTFRGRTLAVLVAAMLVAVAAADSRTSQLATAVTLVAYLFSRGRHGRGVAVTAALIAGVVALVVPLTQASASSTAFTGRAYRWALALDQLRGRWFVGYGSGGWARLQQQTTIVGSEGGYSPHNQWLDALYAGGVLGALALLVLLVVMYRSVMVEDRLGVALVLTAVMTVGILERAWGVSGADWLFWSLLAACLAGARTSPGKADGVVERCVRRQRSKVRPIRRSKTRAPVPVLEPDPVARTPNLWR